MHRMIASLVLVTVAGTVASAQCSSKDTQSHTAGKVVTASYDKKKDAHASKDIVDTAVAAGSFNTLAAALKAAGLVEALKGDGPFTVFAPTDEAFAKLPKGTVESLLKPENKGKLASILKYHVVAGSVDAAEVTNLTAADTLNGQRVAIKVDGSTVKVDGATVTATDVQASNGIIHVIDSVILPTEQNIPQVAMGAGSFKTLTRLLEQAELVDALSGDGPFTVFAPTDEAFAKLPKETIESLLKPENKDKLAAILKYHVVSGRVFSDAAAKGATVTTLNGKSVTTKAEGGKVKVGGATVAGADIDATNGVIHVIDTVLIPQ
jgi:uncharacterized surface protein with fasciclin (FAS1) repeats